MHAFMQKKTVKKIQRKRTETTYCTNLRDAMRNNLPLRANRRGVIFNSDGERPSFAIDELYRNRRIGLSYKQIGKKLGIDPDRENVIHVYKALREEAEEELPSIEDIDAPSKVTPPTPLWYLFDSELEAIAQTALPNPVDIKNVKPQLKLFERLGTHAGYSLSIFMQVGDVLLEELKRSLNCNPGSPVQKLNIWTNKLPIALLTKSWEIQRSVAEAAYMMSSYWAPDQGTCKCGAILTLRFGWKVSPISYPSFFWGCAAFDRRDVGKHDQAKPHRATLWEVISRSLHAMTDKEIEVLREKLTTLGQTWMERNEEQDSPQLVADLQHATDRYGGPKNMIPYKSQSHVAKQLEIMQKKINEHMDSNKEQEKDS